jgi:hypothetical protein
MAAADMKIFLVRCIVYYYGVYHKQGPGLWVDIIWTILSYHNPPLLSPPKGGGGCQGIGGACYLSATGTKRKTISFYKELTFSKNVTVCGIFG